MRGIYTLRFFVFSLMFLFLFSCNNDDKKANSKISSDNPKLLAEMSYEIARIGNDEDKLVAFFNSYGYTLFEGTRAFEKAYNEVLSHAENNKIYQKTIFALMQKSLFGEHNVANDKEKAPPKDKEINKTN